MNQIALTLPWPPSANHYWRRVGHKVLISADGRSYRRAVAECVMLARAELRCGPICVHGPLAVRFEAQPPDLRTRDLDNLFKATLDALTHAGVWPDDGQIDDLSIVRLGPTKGGALRVVVSQIGQQEAA